MVALTVTSCGLGQLGFSFQESAKMRDEVSEKPPPDGVWKSSRMSELKLPQSPLTYGTKYVLNYTILLIIYIL